jgi:preprotein translocase subunit SecA
MTRIGMEDGVPIEHRWISRAIENAQKKVEAHNFDIRKHLLEYDDVMNKQREVVYHRRRELLGGAALKEDILDLCDELIDEIVAAHADTEKDAADWDWKEIEEAFFRQFKFRPGFREGNGTDINTPDDLIELAVDRVHRLYEQREAEFTEPVMRQIEKIVMLQTLDSLWKDHLLAMDHLKEGIGLRGYGQRNPLVEYQKEGFDMFEAMMRVMQQDVVEKVFSVQVRREQDMQQIEQQQQQQQRPQRVMMSHGGETVDAGPQTVKRDGNKVGRNDPCPCGSGKKYKRCHGK